MNLNVGNIAPESEVKICISYLQELNVEQNTFFQFHLSSTISPRYMFNFPGKRAQMQNIQKVQNVEGHYTWNFKITLITTRKIVFHKCSTHDLGLISQNPDSTELTFVMEQ